jgi:enoyl-CoA hydratase/carnithine racemase
MKTQRMLETQLEQLTPAVSLQCDGNLAIVQLTRPEKHNAVNEQTLKGIALAQKAIKKNKAIRAVIITGEGASFCSGLDFPSIMKRPGTAALLYLKLYWPFANLFQRWSMGWRALDVPVIAAIKGHCYGAGMQLALGADFRFAHTDSQLSVMEIKWGLIADMGGPTLLRELVRMDIAKELMMTGRKLSANEALALGLVTRVEQDPMAKAIDFARSLAQQAPNAIAQAKHLIQSTWQTSEHLSLRQERLAQRRLLGKTEQRKTAKSLIKTR